MILIAGPCVVENRDITFRVAEHLKNITEKIGGFDFIFKSSYKKANRTKLDSFTSLGTEEALKILEEIKEQLGLKILTDVHESYECRTVAEIADYLQIPAFLCRQTDLLIAAGETGKTVNIKKGQFMSPEAMRFAVEKVKSTGNDKVWLTERGTTFGYNNLIVDMTAIPRMKKIGVPVIMDATHSVQIPNQTEGVTGGNPEMIETMVLSSLAAGADGIFMETHPNPAEALSDAGSQLQLDKAEAILRKAKAMKELVDSFSK